MTKTILLTASLAITLTGCGGDDPFIHFKPYREAPVLGKDNETQPVIDSDELATHVQSYTVC
jgi:predicted small lipoprotein YifL